MFHKTQEHMIRWSPSVDKRPRRFSRRSSKLTLFPPFLRRTPVRAFFDTDQERKSKDFRRFRAKKLTISFVNYITTCHDYASATLDEFARKHVLCEDDCRTKTLTCEKLGDTSEEETKSFTQITSGTFDLLDEDYQREDEHEEKFEDEMDHEEETSSSVSDQYDSISILSENEEPPDTTDPYMSHQLYIPYNKIHRPRYIKSQTINKYDVTRLPRRPRSPVRQILADKFDLKTAYEQWERKRQDSESRKYLVESKERISQSIKRSSIDEIDKHTPINSMVLQTICEQITLTLIDVNIEIDIQTFVNIAVVWALYELEMYDPYMITEETYPQSQESMLFDWNQQDITDIFGNGGSRKVLMGAYREPFNRNIFKGLHRRLPWLFVSPSHERGHPKFYPTIRERLNEKMSKIGGEEEELTIVPDITCFHPREVLDQCYVAYERKSKFLIPNLPPTSEQDNLILQLLSLM